MFRDIHEKFLKKNGYISVCEGIERSIGSVQYLFKQVHPVRIVRDDTTLLWLKADVAPLRAGTYNFERNHTIYMFPPYDHDEAMDRLSRC